MSVVVGGGAFVQQWWMVGGVVLQLVVGDACFYSFFCGNRGSNPVPFIYYALSLSTKLSSRGLNASILRLYCVVRVC